MKGYFFKSKPKTRQHLADDYRDPELPPLPRIPQFVPKAQDECRSESSQSLKNVLSDPWLIDHLNLVGYKDHKRSIQDVEHIKLVGDILAEQNLLNNARFLQYGVDAATLKELLNDGYALTHDIMIELFKRDKAMLDTLKTVLNKNDIKRLPLEMSRDSRLILGALKNWEDAFKKRDKKTAASVLLYLAMHFQKQDDPSFYWLVYEIYHLAVSSLPTSNGNLTEALILYMFGKFLVEKAKHYKEAQKYLSRVCDISYGYNWTTTFLNGEPDHIHDISAYLLHGLLIQQAFKKSLKHPLEAVNLVKKAVQLVKRANNEDALADAYVDLAVVYNRAHMPERANIIAKDALKIFEQRHDTMKICSTLIFQSHCLRRMKDYKEAVLTLKEVISRARQGGFLTMEGKAYKHLGEYFIGTGEFQLAYRNMKKSASLLAECNLRDELDEVISMLSYIKAWLSLHDVIYIVLKRMVAKGSMFDFLDFVELGLCHLKDYPPLQFVYTFPENSIKENATCNIEAIENEQKLSEETAEMEMEELQEIHLIEDSVMEFYGEFLEKDQVLEYFAFSDFTGPLYDEELDQAVAMFERAGIDPASEVVIKVLKNTPFKLRNSKKAEVNLLAMEIAETQRLLCIQQKLYEQAIANSDKIQVSRKMHLIHQQQSLLMPAEDFDENERNLWDCTFEILPVETWQLLTDWINEATNLAKSIEYDRDSSAEKYKEFLMALLSLAEYYEKYLKISKPLQKSSTVKEADEREDSQQIKPDITLKAKPRATLLPQFIDDAPPPAEVSAALPICKCKEVKT